MITSSEIFLILIFSTGLHLSPAEFNEFNPFRFKTTTLFNAVFMQEFIIVQQNHLTVRQFDTFSHTIYSWNVLNIVRSCFLFCTYDS